MHNNRMHRLACVLASATLAKFKNPSTREYRSGEKFVHVRAHSWLLMYISRAFASYLWYIMSCEHFQYYQTLLNLPNTLLAQSDPHTTEAIIYQNCVILDKSRHWSLLLYKESLHIHRQKAELNHGTRASKELVIFN